MGRFAFFFPGKARSIPAWAGNSRNLPGSARRCLTKPTGCWAFPISEMCFSGTGRGSSSSPQIRSRRFSPCRSRRIGVLEEKGIRPDFVAGHSLGRIFRAGGGRRAGVCRRRAPGAARGKYMQEAVPAGEGAMAAILGLRARSGGGDLPQSSRRPRSSPGKSEFSRADGNFRPRRGGEARRGTSLGERRQARRDAAGFRALSQRADAAGAGAPGEGSARTRSLATCAFRLVTNVDAGIITSGEEAREALIRQVTLARALGRIHARIDRAGRQHVCRSRPRPRAQRPAAADRPLGARAQRRR